MRFISRGLRGGKGWFKEQDDVMILNAEVIYTVHGDVFKVYNSFFFSIKIIIEECTNEIVLSLRIGRFRVQGEVFSKLIQVLELLVVSAGLGKIKQILQFFFVIRVINFKCWLKGNLVSIFIEGFIEL